MRKFRLSTDIISPIHSDISFNDSSLASFGSISDTPDLKKTSESSRCGTPLERDCSSVDSFCKTTLKESAATFDVIVNDIKKQSNINAEKEERFKESYKVLKHSMDELCKKVSHSSILSPVSSGISFENENWTETVPTQKKPNKYSAIQKNPKDCEGPESTKFSCVSKMSSKKSKKKEESSYKMKDNEQSKNLCLFSGSTKNSKYCENKTYQQRKIGVKESNSVGELQNLKTTKTISSSTQTYEHFEAGGANKKENLRNFYLEKQRKPAVSNVLPAAENKTSSIESSIQIAISVEMDNLKRLMMEQNLCSRKELLKLKEAAKEQKKAREYLFSVIEELIDENRKLLSKINKT